MIEKFSIKSILEDIDYSARCEEPENILASATLALAKMKFNELIEKDHGIFPQQKTIPVYEVNVKCTKHNVTHMGTCPYCMREKKEIDDNKANEQINSALALEKQSGKEIANFSSVEDYVKDSLEAIGFGDLNEKK